MSTTLNTQATTEQAQRISKRMGEFRLKFDPKATIEIDASTGEVDPTSQGHAYELEAAGDCEFPGFGFKVLIDDRHNDGDMAQSVVDELFAIAEAYMVVAKRHAERLNREPKPTRYRWEDNQPEFDWETEAQFEQMQKRDDEHDEWVKTLPADAPRIDEPGRVKEVLPNGDLIIDGSGLYRVLDGEEIVHELETRSSAEHRAFIHNCLAPEATAKAVSYADLAK